MELPTPLNSALAENHYDYEQPLVSNHDLEQGDVIKSSTKQSEGIYQRLALMLDEHINVKVQMRVWGTRFEIVLRLMLVTTFLDDFLHTTMDFSEQSKDVNSFILILGLFIQLICSLFLLGLWYPDWSIKALISWIIVQPILYGQLSNFEFIAESSSLIGGLLVLHSHLVCYSSADLTQLVGRVLLPTMYLYYVGHYLMSATTYEETNSYTEFFSSLSIFFVYILAVIVLGIGCSLIAAGLKSRYVALLLGLFNLCFVAYQHPFFNFIRLEGGEWKYEDSMPIPSVALPKDITEFDAEQVYSLHRYYFFLGLSNSGGLLLLAYIGPGNFSLQKDEVLLPEVARARD
jgi:uncharacterized membrane protein YphA (DoxX/SURF4 family)